MTGNGENTNFPMLFSSKKYKFLFSIILVVFLCTDSMAIQKRMLGFQFIPSFASSYLTIESTSVKVNESSSWAYASAVGFFFDYMINPYISFRFDWFLSPGLLNSNMSDLSKNLSRIKVHEAGFTLKRHFEGNIFNPWFGAGPYIQHTAPNEINSYVIHVLLSAGFDYEITEDVFLCPDLKFGLGMQLISSDDESVTVELPSGGDFSTSGIVFFIKLGIAKSF